MKLNKNTQIDIVGKYIMVLNAKESGYKSKLIIPINIFNSEDEKNIFIDKVIKLIN